MPQTKHKVFTISEEEFEQLNENSGGICLACGATQEGDLEPDAENRECESCGENQLFGIEQALIMGRIDFGDDEEE